MLVVLFTLPKMNRRKNKNSQVKTETADIEFNGVFLKDNDCKHVLGWKTVDYPS